MSTYKILRSQVEELLEKTRAYRRSSEYATFFETLAFIKQSRYLAPYNALLVMQQRPTATAVLNEGKWRKKFGRRLRPGVQPLIIMKNYGPVEFVYDIGDIEDIERNPINNCHPNLPTEEICRRLFPMEGDLRGVKGLFEEMARTCRRLGLQFEEAPLTINHAGEVRLKAIDYRVPKQEVIAEKQWLANYIMRVNSTHPIEIRFAAMVHELAHIFCGHLNEFGITGFKARTFDEAEFEAEAVAYLFCYRHGFRPKSEQYLAMFLEKGPQPTLAGFDPILKALKRIEDMLKLEEVTEPAVVFEVALDLHGEMTSYRLRLEQNRLVYEYEGPDNKGDHLLTQEETIPKPKAWGIFWQACHAVGIWGWENSYTNPSHDAGKVSDWYVRIILPDREITSQGSNAYPSEEDFPQSKNNYPPPFLQFLKAVRKLVDGRPFG